MITKGSGSNSEKINDLSIDILVILIANGKLYTECWYIEYALIHKFHVLFLGRKLIFKRQYMAQC